MMNARIYIKIFMAILFLGIMPSCTYDTIHVNGLNEHINVTLTLALDNQSLQVSRATSESAETVIDAVDLFFYGKDAVDATLPVHVEEGITSISDGKISFSMPVDKFNELFPNEETTTCKVFAIVNRPAAIGTDNVLPEVKSVANLKDMVLNTDFTSDQTSFVMRSYNTDENGAEGNGMITINRTDEGGLSGTITVKRVAAKIGFELVYPEGKEQLEVIENNEVTWTATSGDVRIKFFFGSKRTNLGAAFTQYASSDIFNIDYTAYTENLSFYTYPTNWSGDEKAHTHLMVEVIWTEANVAEGETPETKTTYYEISNLNPGSESIESNNYYLIQQSISILGADSEDEAVELTPCYNVLDWGAADLSGVLNRNRYLAVDETNVIMNNIVTKKIKFASSDPIDLTSAEVLWHYTGQEEARDLTMVTHTNSSISKVDEKTYTLSSTTAPITGVANRIDGDYVVTIKINNTQKYIEISHALDNSMTNGSDFTKYLINLKVEHFVEEGEEKGLEEIINITQYPMMYIEAVLNSDYEDRETNGINTNLGYVYVNTKQTGTGWDDINGFPEGSNINNNPNMYIVSISSLGNSSAAQDYIIGDPRTQSAWPTNSGVLSSGVTRTANDGSVLDKYKGTDRDAVAGLIAPQFLVASSYGHCPQMMGVTSLDDAERRCATYQEDGYPAGRWRVPTQAEIKYLIQLSEYQIIPKLFSNNTWYWSAQGAVQYIGNGNFNGPQTGSMQRVRCVYDTWYWGTEPLTSKSFTYADEHR